MINKRPPRRWNARIEGLIGISPKHFLFALRGLVSFFRDCCQYVKKSKRLDGALPLKFKNIFPVTYDKYLSAGSARGHYFFQDIWMARKILEENPDRHVDIGSRIDGFISHLLVFREVEVVDVRKLDSHLPELKFTQDDATLLESFPPNSLKSLSSLHAIEHFGLGRYGDPIDPMGHLKFMKSLIRVLSPGGKLYLGVPIGKERVEFNAHRIIAPETILREFDELTMRDFAAIGDDGLLYEDVQPSDFDEADFSCGLFIFEKHSES